jgi:hypothetical protein
MQDYLYEHRELLWWRDHSELDRKAQRVMTLLREEIHAAGYIGCAKLSDGFVLLGYQGERLSPENKFKVTNQNHLMIRGMVDGGALLTEATSGEATMKLFSQADLKPKNRMIITDCTHGEIFDIKRSYYEKDGWRVELDQPLRFAYAAGAAVGLLAVHEFYIDRSGHANSNTTQISSLFYKNRDGVVKELIQGVDQWTFRLSEKFQNRHRNRSPAEVRNWRDVDGVAIHLTISNEKVTRFWDLYAALS